MKKVLAILFSALLFLSVGSPAFASTDDDISKALEMIGKTNREIDEKIQNAVKKADELHGKYLYEVRKIEEGDKVVKLKEEKAKTLAELDQARDADSRSKLNEKLLEIDRKLAEEQSRIQSQMAAIEAEIETTTYQMVTEEDKDEKKINEKINKLKEKLDSKSLKYQEKTKQFTEDLDKVITTVYNETLKMSNEAIKKAAEKGVIAECSWTLVRFADRWVWIDPVRVIKFSR
ncbi:hypothetical protein [Peribacillus sp. SCS-155]|uniref:hypothetical protein n=1 Tax=Peribacillus sedimenti TaxID=3115297 RepID=UPI0039061D58